MVYECERCNTLVEELNAAKRRAAEPIICGQNPILPPHRLQGCGKRITSVEELYRCAECSTPFHQNCIKRHFGWHTPNKD